jgi:ribosomal protein S6
MEYELLFFTSLANEERIPEIKREIEETINARGGKISADFSDIGKRKLAYPVKKQTHAFFSFCRFMLDEKENLAELNRRLGLADKLMRHLIVRADEVGKPLAAQMARETKKEIIQDKFAKSKEKEKPVEIPLSGTKVGMADLDEKLNEILENPE